MGLRRTTAVAVVLAGAVGGLTLAGGAGAAAKPTVLTAKLSGSKEVPKAGSGSGTARITLNPTNGRVCFNIKLKGVGTTAAGHIHKGGGGKAGPVFIPLFAKPTKAPKGCVTNASFKQAITAILKKPGGYYVNVHTAKFPDGAARGQLTK
jgi:hypothetical protein